MRVRNARGRQLKDIATTAPEASLLAASETLATCDIGLLVVNDEAGNVLGVLSERDVVRSLGRFGAQALERTVAETMTRDIEVAAPDDDLQDVMTRMARGRFRHMPVLEGGRLTGMISARDVIQHLESTVSDQERATLFAKIAWA